MTNDKCKKNDQILAFIHIERSAGTTLIHSLRCNFLFRHADVRPLTNGNPGIFTSSDLRRYLRINPKICSIAGHSIVPYSDLRTDYPNLCYVTLMRNPVQRYLSHYRYWIQRRGKNITFDEFLDIDWIHNFQVKKIAGEHNLEKAIKIINDNISVVGIVEEFNEFLMILGSKLRGCRFKPVYRIVNATRQSGDKLQEVYYKEIVQRNATDIALYDHVVNHILPIQRSKYEFSIGVDLDHYSKPDEKFRLPKDRLLADFILRKTYYEPVTGLIRMGNGAPYKGSY